MGASHLEVVQANDLLDPQILPVMGQELDEIESQKSRATGEEHRAAPKLGPLRLGQAVVDAFHVLLYNLFHIKNSFSVI